MLRIHTMVYDGLAEATHRLFLVGQAVMEKAPRTAPLYRVGLQSVPEQQIQLFIHTTELPGWAQARPFLPIMEVMWYIIPHYHDGLHLEAVQIASHTQPTELPGRVRALPSLTPA